MKKMFDCVILLILAFLVPACSPIYNTEYTYQPPRSDMGKMCTAQCIQAKNSCEQMCELKNENCKLRSHQDALVQYEIYKHDQERAGKEVKRSIDSFDQSWTCHSSCGCGETYNSCYTNCGGSVIGHQVCVAFCNKT